MAGLRELEQRREQDWTRLASGDGEVWRLFLAEQIPRLYGLFMRRWPNPSLAEELVQRTVFDAVRGFGSYDASKGSAAEWLFGIARNHIRLEIRRRATRPKVDGDISTYIDVMDNELLPDEVLEQQETAVVIRAALEKVESKQRDVLTAKYVEGLSARQISERMGVTEKAVHSLLYRARLSLRAELERAAPLLKEEQKQ